MVNEEGDTNPNRISFTRQQGWLLIVCGTGYVILSVLMVVLTTRFVFADNRHPGLGVLVAISEGVCFIVGVRLLYLASQQFKNSR